MTDKVKIKSLKNQAIAGKARKIGDEVQCNSRDAKYLTGAGRAEYVDKPKDKTEPE